MQFKLLGGFHALPDDFKAERARHREDRLHQCARLTVDG
jgi:hypothetical protein